MKAKYKCDRCGFEWETDPYPTMCFRCGNLYVKWVNYEEMEEQWEASEINRRSSEESVDE